jgi:hypothetical protein
VLHIPGVTGLNLDPEACCPGWNFFAVSPDRSWNNALKQATAALPHIFQPFTNTSKYFPEHVFSFCNLFYPYRRDHVSKP